LTANFASSRTGDVGRLLGTPTGTRRGLMDHRRELTFDRIEDVMPEVERLLAGHSTTKGWTLGQILHHLAMAIRLALAPDASGPASPADPHLDRTFKVRRRFFFRSARFPDGQEPPLPALRPPVDADERVEAETLRAELETLRLFEGPFADHPLLGPMSKREWERFHLMHCAHHLGFAKNATPE
jgi:hypothetical protein